MKSSGEPTTGGGLVQVFLARPAAQQPSDLEVAWASLDEEERATAGRFHFDEDRHSYVVSHGLLRAVLGAHLARDPRQIRYRRMPAGRPELAGVDDQPPLRFSLSHARELVGCAVIRTLDVGIDVEAARLPAPVEVADRFFFAEESCRLRALPPDQQVDRFYLLWVLKESYLKATGQGLALPLDSFFVDPGEDGRARIGFVRGGRIEQEPGWTLRWWRVDHHWIALTVRAPAGHVQVSFHVEQRISTLLAA
jgi:4'-phosphopantetheinyl transferase